MEVGTIEQLLVDDHVVEDAWELTSKICAPHRHPASPVLTPTRPYEDGQIQRPDVFFDRAPVSEDARPGRIQSWAGCT